MALESLVMVVGILHTHAVYHPIHRPMVGVPHYFDTKLGVVVSWSDVGNLPMRCLAAFVPLLPIVC